MRNCYSFCTLGEFNKARRTEVSPQNVFQTRRLCLKPVRIQNKIFCLRANKKNGMVCHRWIQISTSWRWPACFETLSQIFFCAYLPLSLFKSENKRAQTKTPSGSLKTIGKLPRLSTDSLGTWTSIRNTPYNVRTSICFFLQVSVTTDCCLRKA